MSERGRPEGQERVPDLMIEKLALGELPEGSAAALRQRLEQDGDQRLAAIGRSNEEILREHPPAEVAAAVQRRLARLEDEDERARARPQTRPGWLMWAPVAAAAGVLLVWTLGGDGGGETKDGSTLIAEADTKLGLADGGTQPEQIFLKGDPMLSIDRVHEGHPERMAAGAKVAQGELLQLGYNAKGAKQGVIVSVDGAGVATLHFPASESDAPLLAHGGPIPLPESYELDDAPGFERFFFVTVDHSEPPMSVASVMEAARTLAASDGAREGELRLPEGWRQQSIRLDK